MPFSGTKLIEMRESLNLTQKQFAAEVVKETGILITRATVSQWELLGRTPREPFFSAICKITKRDPNFFYGFKSLSAVNLLSPTPAPRRNGQGKPQGKVKSKGAVAV